MSVLIEQPVGRPPMDPTRRPKPPMTITPVLPENVAILGNPAGAAAEAIRALRTHIMAQHVGEGRRALAVCGASHGVGRTFIAVNLAVALSQIGLKTLLIDADLRFPGVDQLLPSPRQKVGLRQALSDPDFEFSDAFVEDVVPNLSVLYAGGPADNPQELLAGERFKSLMDNCLVDFDFTIVDTPAANSSSDARRISTVVGYSLIVARQKVSFVNDVRTLAKQLEADHATVVGTVLNEA
jgi:capsular exopolysaccharide synthesis family protein